MRAVGPGHVVVDPPALGEDRRGSWVRWARRWLAAGCACPCRPRSNAEVTDCRGRERYSHRDRIRVGIQTAMAGFSNSPSNNLGIAFERRSGQPIHFSRAVPPLIRLPGVAMSTQTQTPILTTVSNWTIKGETEASKLLNVVQNSLYRNFEHTKITHIATRTLY